MSAYTGPWHQLTVQTQRIRFLRNDIRQWVEETEAYHDTKHPADCDRLPYGHLCALDQMISDDGHDGAGMPMQDGTYRVRYWSTGPDHNGEYDAGLTVEPSDAPDGPGDPGQPAVPDPAGGPDEVARVLVRWTEVYTAVVEVPQAVADAGAARDWLSEDWSWTGQAEAHVADSFLNEVALPVAAVPR